MSNWFFAVFGLFGGFVVSFLFWWWLNHRMVPTIMFPEELSKRPYHFGKFRSRIQIAFKNTGKRSIVDIRYTVLLIINDPLKRGNNIQNIYKLNAGSGDLFILRPGSVRRIGIMPHLSFGLKDSPLLGEIPLKLEEQSLDMDDVFQEYPDAKIKINVIGVDIFSNAVRVFESKMYELSDIRNGVFRGSDMRIYPIVTTENPWGGIE